MAGVHQVKPDTEARFFFLRSACQLGTLAGCPVRLPLKESRDPYSIPVPCMFGLVFLRVTERGECVLRSPELRELVPALSHFCCFGFVSKGTPKNVLVLFRLKSTKGGVPPKSAGCPPKKCLFFSASLSQRAGAKFRSVSTPAYCL